MKASILTAAFAALALMAAPVYGQSTGPSHSGFDPSAPRGGHYHVGEVGEKLMILETALKCDCGCGLDVHSCQFQMQCGTAPVWSVRIREALERGESVEAIQASFVSEFGMKVLMAPPREGFNLVGYFLPAFGIITMGMLIGLLIRNGSVGRERTVGVTHLSEQDEARLQAALRKVDAEESPDW
jgi:hypothetical protein